jgi:hypothetical protein
MVIVCKSVNEFGNGGYMYIHLTIGKSYLAFSDFLDNDIMVDLVDDIGNRGWYPKINFYSLSENRSNNLRKIGI